MRYGLKAVTVFARLDKQLSRVIRVAKRQVGDEVVAFELLEHLIGADFPALVHRVKQFGF
jgi:hypothetical protein